MPEAARRLIGHLLPMSIVISILSIAVCGCGEMSRVPRSARCAPVSYPEGTRVNALSYEVRTYRVEDALAEVTSFLDKELKPVPISEGDQFGVWRVEAIDGSQVLYSCSAAMQNLWQEAESGCILVKADGNQTLIQSVWYLTGDAPYPCGPGLAIERRE